MEGRAMVNAARKFGRTVQVGTHRRVSPHNISGMEFLKSGKVGKIGMVRAFVHYGGDAGRMLPETEPPKELDWDFWCGPAPLHTYNAGMHPKGFRQYMDYANGQLGDWGIHWLDQVMWWTEEKYSKNFSQRAEEPQKEIIPTHPTIKWQSGNLKILRSHGNTECLRVTMPKRLTSVVIFMEQKAHSTWDGKMVGRFIPIIKIR